MKIKNQKVTFLGFVATLLFNIFVLFGFNILFLGSAYSFIYLCIVPGFFIKRLLRIQSDSTFDSITYIVGLSISYLLIVGISTNYLIPSLFTSQKLNAMNCLLFFDIYTIPLIIINQINKDKSVIRIEWPKVTFIQLFFYIIPFFFPILSIAGVQLLNIGGTNIFIMMLLFTITAYVLLVTIFIRNLEHFHFEVPVYLIAISLFFTMSLRSSYIIGWDIHQEFKVFLLTESHQLWAMANYQDPYNACLSITILPTLFHYFTKIDNASVFKILYQFPFALLPIIIYSIARKFTNCLLSFLSVFFFMSPVGFLGMSNMLRQSIAYLFFGLLLLILFSKQIVPIQKKILFIIFSFSMVLSHYSTTYIAIALFGPASIILTIYKKTAYKFFNETPEDFVLKPILVFCFILFSFIWFGPITHASNNFLGVINDTRKNITNFEKQTLNTSIVDQFTKFPEAKNTQVLLNENITSTLKQYKDKNFTFYPRSAYKGYLPTIQKDNLPLHTSHIISNMIYFFEFDTVKVFKLLIMTGFAATIILFRKNFFPAEYTVLSIGFALAIILLTSVPAISLFYPVGRLYQQTLFLIALPTILSIYWLLRFIPYKLRMIIITITIANYFLFANAFIPQLVGGQEPQIFLNNSGLYYNEIYLHPSEVASIHWLFSKNKELAPIFADIGSSEKMTEYNPQTYLNTYQVFPSLIDKNGYVYSSYGNTLDGIGIVNLNDARIEYNFPNEFLNNNKNLIYNNHYTRIYK